MSYVVRRLKYVRGGLVLSIRGQAERLEYAIGIQENTCNRWTCGLWQHHTETPIPPSIPLFLCMHILTSILEGIHFRGWLKKTCSQPSTTSMQHTPPQSRISTKSYNNNNMHARSRFRSIWGYIWAYQPIRLGYVLPVDNFHAMPCKISDLTYIFIVRTLAR